MTERAGGEPKGVLITIDSISSSVFLAEQVDIEIYRERGELAPIRLTVRPEEGEPATAWLAAEDARRVVQALMAALGSVYLGS